MLIFIHQYLLIKIKKKNPLKKKIIISKSIIFNKHIHLLNNFNKFDKLLNNLFNSNIKPYFLLSKKFSNEELFINNYINLLDCRKINFLFIINTQITKKMLTFYKKINLPIFIISNQFINKNYFEYFFFIKNYNNILEYYILEFILSIFIKLKNKNIFKKTYFELNLLNKTKINV